MDTNNVQNSTQPIVVRPFEQDPVRIDLPQPPIEIDINWNWDCLPPNRRRPLPAGQRPQRAITVEDRIQELLCNIMAKMDDKIEAHAKEIEALQAGTATTTTGVNKSVDIETMKLKHEIDQRTALFDMLRQIMDKYQQTTNEVVRSMGR